MSDYKQTVEFFKIEERLESVWDGHFDGDFFYAMECPECHTRYLDDYPTKPSTLQRGIDNE